MTKSSFAREIDRVLSANSRSLSHLGDERLDVDYAGLSRLLTAITSCIQDAGISRGECIAVEADNSLLSVAIVLALLREGQDFLLQSPPAEAGSGSEESEQRPCFLSHVLTILSPIGNEQDLDSLLRRPEDFLKLQANPDYPGAALEVGPGARRMLMRTSGTTGEAKYVVHKQDNFLKNVLGCIERFRIQSKDRVLIAAPICHLYGLGAGLLPSVLAGSSVRLLDKPNILKMLDCERSFKPNVAFITPTLGEVMLRSRKPPTEYDRAVTAGDRLKEETFRGLDERFGCLINLYGSSEMGAISSNSPGDPIEERCGTVGAAIPGMELRLKSTSEAERQGELMCRNRHGFLGYVDREGKEIPARELAGPQGWLSTNDIAEVTESGAFRIIGRSNLSTNRSGKLVTFAEIERKIEGLIEVSRVAIVEGEKSCVYGKELIAACTINGSGSVTEKSLKKSCTGLLPKRLLPDRFLVMKEFPYFKNGKLDRESLREMVRQA